MNAVPRIIGYLINSVLVALTYLGLTPTSGNPGGIAEVQIASGEYLYRPHQPGQLLSDQSGHGSVESVAANGIGPNPVSVVTVGPCQ